ncbi:TlpA family protein disulfide reductase [Desertibaculum subflavum]|uniref:TlpA family protein disulfide reductase n=1 Tax=Desertibaculum subflavum TaxID=2268458 RepID=UPI000E6642D0
MRALACIAFSAVLLHIGPASAADPPGNFAIHDAPKAVPAIEFQDGDGRQWRLADFHGKVVVLNIWATWCGPCRHEMPTLDRLQAKLGGPGFEVVALSIDRAGPKVVVKFYAEVGVKRLAMYIDSSGKAARDLGSLGLPTTLLIDREGREIGRLVGPAEWDAPEMVVFIRERIDGKTGARSSGDHERLARMPGQTEGPLVSTDQGIDKEEGR